MARTLRHIHDPSNRAETKAEGTYPEGANIGRDVYKMSVLFCVADQRHELPHIKRERE